MGLSFPSFFLLLVRFPFCPLCLLLFSSSPNLLRNVPEVRLEQTLITSYFSFLFSLFLLFLPNSNSVGREHRT